MAWQEIRSRAVSSSFWATLTGHISKGVWMTQVITRWGAFCSSSRERGTCMSYSFREYLVSKDKNRFYSSPFSRWFYFLVPIVWFSKDANALNLLISEAVFLVLMFILYLVNKQKKNNEKFIE